MNTLKRRAISYLGSSYDWYTGYDIHTGRDPLTGLRRLDGVEEEGGTDRLRRFAGGPASYLVGAAARGAEVGFGILWLRFFWGLSLEDIAEMRREIRQEKREGHRCTR